MNTFSAGILKRSIGEVGGVPVEIDVTLLLAFPVVVFWIQQEAMLRLAAAAVTLLWAHPVRVAGLGPWTPRIYGAVVPFGCIVSLLVHELGHARVGQRVGIEPVGISLWILGGGVRFERQTHPLKAELSTLSAGPVSSTVLGLGLWLGLLGLPTESQAVALVVGVLAAFNLAVGGLSLLPTFPLDGAYVLRSLLSGIAPLESANRVVGAVGRLVALGIIASNVLLPETIVVALFGVFCYVATIAETGTAATAAFLEGITVSSFVTHPKEPLRVDDPIDTAVRRVHAERGHTGIADLAYPVVDGVGSLTGVVPAREVLKRHRNERQGSLHVRDVMSNEYVVVPGDEPALDVYEQLRDDVKYVVVTGTNDEPLDVLTRTGFIRAVERKERIAGYPRSTWP